MKTRRGTLARSTKRLTVRPLRATDFKAWRDAYLGAGEKQNEWDRSRRPLAELRPPSFKKLLKTQKLTRLRDEKVDFGIFRKDTGEYIGAVSIIAINRSFLQSAIVGYSLFPSHWRQGFGKEFLRAAMDIAFRDLKLHRLHAPISPKNVRSKKLAKSLKFRNEGLCRRYLLIDGVWTDHCIFAITAEEYLG